MFLSFYSDCCEIELWRNLIAKEAELLKLMEDSDSCNEEVPSAGPACKEDSLATSQQYTPAAALSHQAVTPDPSSVVPAVAPASTHEVPSPKINSKEDFPALGSRRRGTNPTSGPSEGDPAPVQNKLATPVPGLSYKEVATGVGPAYNITASVNGPRNYSEFLLGFKQSDRSDATEAGLSNGVASPVNGPSNRHEPTPVAGQMVAGGGESIAARKELAPGPSRYVDVPAESPRSRIAASIPGLSNGPSSVPGLCCNGVASAPGPSRDEAVPGPSSVPGLGNRVASTPGPSNRVTTRIGPVCPPSTSAAGPSCDKATPALLPNKALAPADANQKAVAPMPSCKKVDQIPGPSRKPADLIPGPSRKDPDPPPGFNRNDAAPDPAQRRRRFVPVDPDDAERRRADDVGLGFNVVAIGEDGVPEVSANGGYEVVEEGHDSVDENENGEDANENGDEGDDETSEESEESSLASEVDSCYYSSEGGDDNIVFLIAAPPARALPRPQFIGYYRCRCLRH